MVAGGPLAKASFHNGAKHAELCLTCGEGVRHGLSDRKAALESRCLRLACRGHQRAFSEAAHRLVHQLGGNAHKRQSVSWKLPHTRAASFARGASSTPTDGNGQAVLEGLGFHLEGVGQGSRGAAPVAVLVHCC